MGQRMIGFLSVLGLVVIGQLAMAQDFSADVYNSGRGGGGNGKIYATKDKVRWELQQRDSRMGGGAIVIDEAKGTHFILMDQQHMYMESMPGMMKNTPTITQFWHVQDVNDACPQWKTLAEQSKNENWGSCSKVGSDSVNGRSAVKYEGVSSKGEKSYVWIDTKLKCVAKFQNDSQTWELRNIQEGSQPTSLFEIPAGYRKFDMGAMRGQMGRQQ